MNQYNLDKLVKIECNDFKLSHWYIYKKKVTFLGIKIQDEGVYRKIFERYESKEAPKYHTIKDGQVYENPEVILHYQANHAKTYCFDSFEKAKEFADQITSTGNWIK